MQKNKMFNFDYSYLSLPNQFYSITESNIFPNPEDGGQAPFTIWKQAIKSGLFKELSTINSLGLLRRI